MKTKTTQPLRSSYLPREPWAKSCLDAAARPAEKFTLVIPTLREAESVAVLLPRIRAELATLPIDYKILVVDDDSGDGIEAVVAAFADNARVQLVTRKGTRGLAGAILHGWEQTDAELLGVMDADLQHPPELLPQLVESVLSGCDLAIGSRYVRGGRVRGWHALRRGLSALAIWASWPLQRAVHPVHDPMSGCFVVRRRCVEGIDFQRHGFKLLLEILVRGRIGEVREVPFVFGTRRAGQSKAGLRTAWEYAGLLARLYRARLSAVQELGEAAAD